ncbi:MoaD/ThiS family protein [Candidatus Woesearchaeota archaeon]|nr:MoaD/ThiS family protein [Candidatus Woesearchaeota archaeon]
MVKVFIERENRNVNIKALSVIELLKKLRINKEVVLVVKNGVLVTEEEKLNEKDKIELISVISGG